MPKFLILGGTSEANIIAKHLAKIGADALYSYAGRTAAPRDISLPVHIGGFGGVDGLIQFMRTHNITHLLDATHPFACQISTNAVHACENSGISLLRFERKAWKRTVNDDWITFRDIDMVVNWINTQNFTKIFLATGKQSMPKFVKLENVNIVARIVDKAPKGSFGFQNAVFEVARGPFNEEDDITLFKKHKIDLIVSKNSGGEGAYAKIKAARRLNIPVAMIERPFIDAPVDFQDVRLLLTHLEDLGE